MTWRRSLDPMMFTRTLLLCDAAGFCFFSQTAESNKQKLELLLTFFQNLDNVHYCWVSLTSPLADVVIAVKLHFYGHLNRCKTKWGETWHTWKEFLWLLTRSVCERRPLQIKARKKRYLLHSHDVYGPILLPSIGNKTSCSEFSVQWKPVYPL